MKVYNKEEGLEVRFTGVEGIRQGKWIIKVNGIELELESHNNFNTYGKYEKIGGLDISLENGLSKVDWIVEVIATDANGLLTAIKDNFDFRSHFEILKDLYPLINEQDFRSLSCDGVVLH